MDGSPKEYDSNNRGTRIWRTVTKRLYAETSLDPYKKKKKKAQ
eukprot:SAG11_NODE_36710_length_260_cov_0.677019_1_plen_42_part_10